MSLPITILNINLDTNRPNLNINTITGERFLQGNSDKTFIFTLLKNGENVTLTDGIKATVILIFYNGNTVYKKYMIAPKNPDGTANNDYNIDPVANGKISIPLSKNKAFYDHAGRTDLIIYLEDGNNFYTYSCTYNMDANEAYTSSGIIDNLPSIDSIKNDVSTLKTQMATANTNIATNTNNIATKANSNLSNVGNFASAPDGALLYKKDGQLKPTPIKIDDTNKVINSPYSLKVPPNTIDLGTNISIEENGGFIEFVSNVSGKKYLLLDYENDPSTGTSRPIWYERGVLTQKVALQANDTQNMNNVTSISLGKPTQDYQVQAFYLNLVNGVNNLKAKLVINSKTAAYYPSEQAWNDNTVSGYNLVSGLQRISISPFWSTLTIYNTVVLEIKADSAINLKGDGTTPYFAVDLNYITKKNVATLEDLPTVNVETGATIRDKLQSLSGNDRLDASAIKNIVSEIKVANEEGSLEYTVDKLLFPFATVEDDGGIATINTSFVVTDENAEIVPDCSVIEVPSTSLISANQNTGNSNAAVLDFKGLPIDMGDGTVVVNAKHLSIPEGFVTKLDDNGKVQIDVGSSISTDGTIKVGRLQDLEVPSDGGLTVETISGVTGTGILKAKGFKATRNGVLEVDGVKTLAFNDDDLIIGTEDITDSSKLNVEFLGLPISKTNTSSVRKATKLEFPQANVFGQDGGTVHIGTGHSVNKNDPVGGAEEVTAACNNWTFTNGLNAEANPNDPNGVIISSTDAAGGISIANDDTQAANNTLFAYFPQARIADGSVSDSKVIKTSIPLTQDTNTFDDYKKISLSTHDFLVTRKQDDNDTLELNFNGISVDSQGNELPGIKLISLDNEQFEAQGGEVGVADVMLKNPTRSGYLAYINDEMVIPHEFGNRTRVTKIFPNDVLINDSAVITNDAEKTYTLLAGENGISYNYLISAVINTKLYYDDFNDTFKLYLWDEEGNDYLSDINGNPCIAIKSQQKGTLECTVELTAVVKLATNTKISLRLEDSLSTRLLFIPGILTKISGICIEKLLDDNQLSLARTQFQMDTMRALRVSKHVYGNRFLDAASYLKPGYNLETQNINSDTYALNIDNWLLLCERRSGTVKIENGVMKVLPGADPNYISYGYVIPSETTINLRGTQLEFDIQTEYRHGDMILEAFSWSGQRDDIVPALPQFNSIDENGVYTLKDGWSVITSSTINLPSQGTPVQETKICSATVPTDCNNIYFVIRSKGIQVSELWVSGAAIGVPGDAPVVKWDINTPLNYNEQHLVHDITTAKFSCNEDSPKDAKMNWADAGVRNQVNIGAKVLGDAPIDLVKTPQNNDVDQYYGQTHWRGYLKANFTGTMDVAYSYGVSNWSIADTTDTLTLYMAKGADIATAVKIPNSESTWTITKAGSQSQTPDKTMMAVFKVTGIQPNDKFWMIAEATNGRKFMIADQNEIMITVDALDQYDIDQQNKIDDLESQIQALQAVIRTTADAKTNKAYVELGWDSGNNKPLLEAKQDTTP